MWNANKKIFFIGIAVIAVLIILALLLAIPKASEGPINNTAQEFMKYKTDYVGDASKVGNILALLQYPDDVSYDYFELQTDNQPYSVTVYLKSDVLLSSLDQTLYDKNALIMFALIANLDGIEFVLNEERLQFTRGWANDRVNKDIRGYGQTEEEFAEFINMLDNYETPDSRAS